MNVFEFPELPSICPVLSLRDYLARMAPLRHADSNKLFTSLCKPHKSVSSQTLARWVTNIMKSAGIDTLVFCQHSTHSALAAWSETGTKKMSVVQICIQAQWSSFTTTYRKILSKSSLPNRRGIEVI